MRELFSEPAVAIEIALDLRLPEVEVGSVSPLRDKVISASDLVMDIALLLRTWPLLVADDPGRSSPETIE